MNAAARIIITDTATQSRRHVEWGLEGQYYNPSTSLLIDSDDMVTSGFAGTQTTTFGAYDPNASGNNSITCGLSTSATAVAGTGNLSHVGTFLMKGRVQATTTNVEVRLTWQSADGPLMSNDWVQLVVGSSWEERDLGTITVPTVLSGTQRWTARVEARTTTGTDTLKLDYLILIPTLEGYGKARAPARTAPGVLTGYDQFTGTTAGGALNARSAPSGGAWATSGDATDFVFADAPSTSEETVTRSAASGTVGRFAILGTATPTDVQVETSSYAAGVPTVVGTALTRGVIARWTDSSNHLRASLLYARVTEHFTNVLRLVLSADVVVGGTPTTYTRIIHSSIATTGAWYVLRLITYASGRAILQLLDSTAAATVASLDFTDPALATGGTLASGKSGLYDLSTASFSIVRYYDNFAVSTPVPEPIVLYSGRNMQIRHDDTIRQDSTGTYTGRTPSYRGSRFLVPVGTSRVIVKARRNDVDVAADANVTDSLQIQIGWTPRGIAVPR